MLIGSGEARGAFAFPDFGPTLMLAPPQIFRPCDIPELVTNITLWLFSLENQERLWHRKKLLKV